MGCEDQRAVNCGACRAEIEQRYSQSISVAETGLRELAMSKLASKCVVRSFNGLGASVEDASKIVNDAKVRAIKLVDVVFAAENRLKKEQNAEKQEKLKLIVTEGNKALQEIQGILTTVSKMLPEGAKSVSDSDFNKISVGIERINELCNAVERAAASVDGGSWLVPAIALGAILLLGWWASSGSD
jgi:hypothetical protein